MLLSVSACATYKVRRIPDRIFSYDAKGSSSDEVRGYRDGCNAAKNSLNLGIKEIAPPSGVAYRNGWIKGNAICLEQGMNYLYKFKQPRVQPNSQYEAMEQEMIWNELKK